MFTFRSGMVFIGVKMLFIKENVFMEIGPLVIVVIGGLCGLYLILDAVKDMVAKFRRNNTGHSPGIPSQEVKEIVENVLTSAGSAETTSDTVYEEEDREAISSVTRKVMTDVLDAIGCQYNDGNEGELIVKYQGETFVMSFGGHLARIWDYGWMSVNVDDPTVPLLRHAINHSNYYTGNAVVLGIDKDGSKLWLHTVDTILMHPSNPDNESYVRSVLDNFFATKQHLGKLYQDMVGVHSAGNEEEKAGVAASFRAPSPN